MRIMLEKHHPPPWKVRETSSGTKIVRDRNHAEVMSFTEESYLGDEEVYELVAIVNMFWEKIK